MIERIVQDYLVENTDVPCYPEMPEEPPKSFALIEKTGSGESNYILSATIAIQSYASTLYKAACLNESVKAAMRKIKGLPQISSCNLNSDYNFTDSNKKKYRYQAVFDIYYYE